jgi:hypothetical protein
MAEPLRPLSTGELLDRTFSLYKRDFALFAVIAFPAPALYCAYQIFFLNSRSSAMLQAASRGSRATGLGAVAGGFVATIWLGIFFYMLGHAITNAATVRAVSAVHLGRSTTAREAYAGLSGKYLRIVAVFLLALLIAGGGSVLLLVAASLILGVGIAAFAKMGTVAVVIGSIVGIAALVAAAMLGIGLFVRYSLAVQACAVEDLGVGASLKRSGLLAKGSRGRIITVYTLFAILNFVIAFSLGYGFRILVVPMHSWALTLGAGNASSLISGVLLSPLPAIAMSLVYYDERVRKEAFDLQVMMAALETPQPESATSAT